MASIDAAQPPGPPYPPRSAALGGIPRPLPDIPISAVLLLLFTLLFTFHLLSLLHDLSHSRPRPSTPTPFRRRPFHVPALLLTLFPLLRIVSLAVRIAAAPHRLLPNTNLGLAATALSSAGVVVVVVLNLLLTRRFARDYSVFSHHPGPIRVCRFLVFAAFTALVMVVSGTVDGYYTRDEKALQTARAVLLGGVTILTVLAAVPAAVMLAFPAMRDRGLVGADRVRFRARWWLLVVTSLMVTLDVGFRCGVAYDVRPIESPGWFNSKAALYCFGYLVELAVLVAYAVSRFDRRFRSETVEKGAGREESAGRKAGLAGRINTASDVFGVDRRDVASSPLEEFGRDDAAYGRD